MSFTNTTQNPDKLKEISCTKYLSTSITDILISAHRHENISVWEFCKNNEQSSRDNPGKSPQIPDKVNSVIN
jgi:hypothetical protein